VQFNILLKETIAKLNQDKGWKVPIPAGETGYYDVTVDTTNNEFIPWKSIQNEFTFNSRMSFDEIVVPTEDSTKYLEISSTLLKSHNHILKCGGTGTGKSLNCDSLIAMFPASRYTAVTIAFSAQTGVMSIHQSLGPKLKRRKAGILGPDNNKKGIVLVDDINMPKKEK